MLSHLVGATDCMISMTATQAFILTSALAILPRGVATSPQRDIAFTSAVRFRLLIMIVRSTLLSTVVGLRPATEMMKTNIATQHCCQTIIIACPKRALNVRAPDTHFRTAVDESFTITQTMTTECPRSASPEDPKTQLKSMHMASTHGQRDSSQHIQVTILANQEATATTHARRATARVRRSPKIAEATAVGKSTLGAAEMNKIIARKCPNPHSRAELGQRIQTAIPGHHQATENTNTQPTIIPISESLTTAADAVKKSLTAIEPEGAMEEVLELAETAHLMRMANRNSIERYHHQTLQRICRIITLH